MALIQLLMSSSEVAWYILLNCGVMTSKQNRRSASRAMRTDAMRRSIGSMCRSNFCFQLLYSERRPWSSTIQNLSHISDHSSYAVKFDLLMPSLLVDAFRVNVRSRSAKCPQQALFPLFPPACLVCIRVIAVSFFQVPNASETVWTR